MWQVPREAVPHKGGLLISPTKREASEVEEPVGGGEGHTATSGGTRDGAGYHPGLDYLRVTADRQAASSGEGRSGGTAISQEEVLGHKSNIPVAVTSWKCLGVGAGETCLGVGGRGWLSGCLAPGSPWVGQQEEAAVMAQSLHCGPRYHLSGPRDWDTLR